MFDPIINSDNDDDIFDDAKPLSNSDTSFSSDTSKQESLNDVLNDAIFELFNDNDDAEQGVTKLIEHLRNKHKINLSDILGNLRIEFVQQFYTSVHRWIFDYHVVNTPIAVYDCLTILTEGKYPLYAKYRELEVLIPKRKVIIKFLDSTFCSPNADKAFTKIASLFDVNMDSRFANTYFFTVREMIYLTLIQEIGLYKALAEDIGHPIDENVVSLTASAAIPSYDELRDTLFANAIHPILKDSIASHILEEMSKYEVKEG